LLKIVMVRTRLASALLIAVALLDALQLDAPAAQSSADRRPACQAVEHYRLAWSPVGIMRASDVVRLLVSDSKGLICSASAIECDRCQLISTVSSHAQARSSLRLLSLHALRVKLQV
jgi:hypothetical protein